MSKKSKKYYKLEVDGRLYDQVFASKTKYLKEASRLKGIIVYEYDEDGQRKVAYFG